MSKKIKALLFYSKFSKACADLFRKYDHIEWNRYFTFISVDNEDVRNIISKEIDKVPTIALIKNGSILQIYTEESLFNWLDINTPRPPEKEKKPVHREEVAEEPVHTEPPHQEYIPKEEMKSEDFRVIEDDQLDLASSHKNFGEISGMGNSNKATSAKSAAVSELKERMARERDQMLENEKIMRPEDK